VHATSSLVLLIRELRRVPVVGCVRWGSVEHALSVLLSRYGYTLVVAFTSAMLTFPFGFFRSAPEDVINELFGASPFDFSARWSNPSLIVNLTIYTVCKFVFTVIAVGCPISCGVFTPVFLIGAASGRCFGELVNLLMPPEFKVTAGGYAVVGAAAMSAGVTRTVSCAVMVFELTGQLNHMLPVLVAVLIAYGVGNVINESIYDTMLELNNLPYLKPPQLLDDSTKRTACDVMERNVAVLHCLPTYLDAYILLEKSRDTEFAVLDGPADRLLLGSVRRSTLQRLLEAQLNGPRRHIGHFERLSEMWSRRKSGWIVGATLPAGYQGRGDSVADTMLFTGGNCGVGGAAAITKIDGGICNGFAHSEDKEGKGRNDWQRPSVGGGGCVGEQRAAVEVVASLVSLPSTRRPSREEMGLSGAPLSEDEFERLLATPLDLGIDREEMLACSVQPNQRPPSSALVDLAPNVILAGTPLQQVHMQFSLLGIERAYVTFGGRLYGVIRRAHLHTRDESPGFPSP